MVSANSKTRRVPVVFRLTASFNFWSNLKKNNNTRISPWLSCSFRVCFRDFIWLPDASSTMKDNITVFLQLLPIVIWETKLVFEYVAGYKLQLIEYLRLFRSQILETLKMIFKKLKAVRITNARYSANVTLITTPILNKKLQASKIICEMNEAIIWTPIPFVIRLWPIYTSILL